MCKGTTGWRKQWVPFLTHVMGSTPQRDVVMVDQSPLLRLLLFMDAAVGLLVWKNNTENFSRQFYINGIFSPGIAGLPPTPPLPGIVIKKRKRYTVEEVSKSESWVIRADKLNKKKQVSSRKTDLKESCLHWDSC